MKDPATLTRNTQLIARVQEDGRCVHTNMFRYQVVVGRDNRPLRTFQDHWCSTAQAKAETYAQAHNKARGEQRTRTHLVL